MVTVCTGWRAMSGSGSPTGTARTTTHGSPEPVEWRAILRARPTASIPPNPACRSGCKRAARSSAPTSTAPATCPGAAARARRTRGRTTSASGWSGLVERAPVSWTRVAALLLGLGCIHVPPDVPESEAPTGGRLAVADGWLAGISRGVAPGAPVVFVHGFGGNRHFFDAQLAQVEDHARVIAYDQRGCGESSLAP